MTSLRAFPLWAVLAGTAFLLVVTGCTAPKTATTTRVGKTAAVVGATTTPNPASHDAAPVAEGPLTAAQTPVPDVASAVPAPTQPATPAEVLPSGPAPAPGPVGARASIRGSQETSLLLDNYTAFIAGVDGRKIRAGRDGWDIPVQLETGRRILEVEFNRGVFVARARLEFEAEARCTYELRYQTDAELFGRNSYCKFWIVDTGTNKVVSLIKQAAMEKVVETASRAALP